MPRASARPATENVPRETFRPYEVYDMHPKLILAALTAATIALLATPADARKLHSRSVAALAAFGTYQPDNNGHLVFAPSGATGAPRTASRGRSLAGKATRTGSYGRQAKRTHPGASQGEVAYLPHPAGCPRRAFCGCGVSVKVFGRPVRSLYLAANWLKFQRALPAAGMVAARRGHVMYIEQYNGGNEALVYDPNSGGHKTRLHLRSLSGYRIVNPSQREAHAHLSATP